MLLLLGGCIQFHHTQALWEPNRHVASFDRQQAKLAVDSVSVCREEGADAATRVLLGTHRERGRITASLRPELDGPRWFSLAWPEDPLTARAMADLFACQSIGPIDRCAIEASWTLTFQGERNWEGYVELHGELSPELRRAELDEAEALTLLASPAVIPVIAAGGDLRHCIETASRVDWRILLPSAADGSGRVVGCLLRKPRSTLAMDDASAVDLLVCTGLSATHRYLRVPAAAVPALALAWRDPRTLFDRFVVQAWSQVRLAPEPPAGTPEFAPPRSTTFRLTSGGEELDRHRYPLLKAVATPFYVAWDALIWFWEHGPMQLFSPPPDRGPPPKRNR